MTDRKPSVDKLIELLKAAGNQELAELKSELRKIVERYEEIRAINPKLFASPLLDDVATVWDTHDRRTDHGT